MQRLFTPPPTPRGLLNEVIKSEDTPWKHSSDRVHLTSNPDEIIIEGSDGNACIVNLLTSHTKTLPIVFKEIGYVFTLPDGRIIYRGLQTKPPRIITRIYDPQSNKSDQTSINVYSCYMPSPTELICCGLSHNGILVYHLPDLINPVIRFFDTTFKAGSSSSFTKLGDYIVASNCYGKVHVYLTQKNTLVQVDDISDELLALRNAPTPRFDSKILKTIGAKRDTLLVIDEMAGGLISTWKLVDGKLKKLAHGIHRLLARRASVCELKNSGQFLLTDESTKFNVCDEDLQLGVIQHQEQLLGKSSPLSDGRFLFVVQAMAIKILTLGVLMTREEQVEFFRTQIDEAIPCLNNGPLVRMIADYLSGKEERVVDDEKACRPSLR